jgi:hypothetical protein
MAAAGVYEPADNSKEAASIGPDAFVKTVTWVAGDKGHAFGL